MTRKTMVINLDRCSGCDSCVAVCKYANHLPLGEYYNRVVRVGPSGTFPDVERYWLPVNCQQCEHPQCIQVCPTGASYRDKKTGIVLVNTNKCIGCQYCVYACPYGVRVVRQETGVVEKCTLCFHRTADGSEEPECVHNCPTAARIFGDLDDPESRVSQELAKYPDECIHHLPDSVGAAPTVRYILSPEVASWKELTR